MARELQRELLKVRVEVEQVCGLLRFPTWDVLQGSMLVLEKAGRELAESRRCADDCRNKDDMLLEARRLQVIVHRARKLLDAARDYQTQWIGRLPPASFEYVPGGGPAALQRTPGFSLSG